MWQNNENIIKSQSFPLSIGNYSSSSSLWSLNPRVPVLVQRPINHPTKSPRWNNAGSCLLDENAVLISIESSWDSPRSFFAVHFNLLYPGVLGLVDKRRSKINREQKATITTRRRISGASPRVIHCERGESTWFNAILGARQPLWHRATLGNC